MNTMVEVINKEVVIDTRILSRSFETEHRFVIELIGKHLPSLERFGVLRFQTVKPKTGRPMKIAYLNEPQALLLLTYTRSRPATDDLRHKLISDFMSMRRALLDISVNRKNQEWLSNRSVGKLQRKITTDIIRDFVAYAESQGSANAKRYYSNISKMENASLFFIVQKFPNMREAMDHRQLSFIQSADTIVQEAIREGMSDGIVYKEIYQLCKKRIESFSSLIPKTTIPMGIEA